MIDNNWRILSANQINQLHETTLRIFNEVGLEVLDEKARQTWVDFGATRGQRYQQNPYSTCPGIKSFKKVKSRK